MNESNNLDKMNEKLENLSQELEIAIKEHFKQAKKEMDKFLVKDSEIAIKTRVSQYITHINEQCRKLGYPERRFKIFENKGATWQDIWNISVMKLHLDETEAVSLFCDVLFDIISIYKGNSPKDKGIFAAKMLQEATLNTNEGLSALAQELLDLPLQEEQGIYPLLSGYIVYNLEDILHKYKKLKHNLENDEMCLPMTVDVVIQKVQDTSIERDSYISEDDEKVAEDNKLLFLTMKSPYPYLSLKIIIHREKFLKYFSLKINKENGRTYRSVYDQYDLYQELSMGSLVSEKTLINEVFAEDFMCYNATAYLFDGFSRLFKPFVEKYTKGEERIDVKELFEKYKYYPEQETDIEILKDFPEPTQIFLQYVIFYTGQYISIRNPILRIKECQKFAECLKEFEQSISKESNDSKRKQILSYLNNNVGYFMNYIEICKGEYGKKLIYISKMVNENIYSYISDAFGTIGEQSKLVEDLLKECGKDSLGILELQYSPHQDSRYELLFAKMPKEGNSEKLPRNKYKSLSHIILTKAIQYNSCNYSIYNKYMDELNSKELIVYNGKLMKRE